MVTNEQLNALRPEGMEDEMWNSLSEKFLELNKSDNNGLLMNEQKLKEEKQKVQEKNRALETEHTKLQEQYAALNKQLQDNSPDSIKKIYEDKNKELQDLLNGTKNDLTSQLAQRDELIKSLQQGVLERDCYAEFDKAISGKNIDPSSVQYLRTMILGENASKFAWRNVGDDKILASADGKTIRRAIDEFTASDFGKHFVLNGSTGGNADGSRGISSTAKVLTRAQFDALTPPEQAEKMRNGYKIKS